MYDDESLMILTFVVLTCDLPVLMHSIFRLPEEMFADSSSNSNICEELLVNGNAEDPSLHPFTYPLSRTQGDSVLTLEEEELNGATNYFYRLTNRRYSWSSPSYFLSTDCVTADTVYSISADIRVHSNTPKSFRFQLTVVNADGSKSWPWLGTCAPQSLADGWVTCSSSYQFNSMQGSASELKFYFVSDDSTHDDIDLDNMSISFQSGPVKSLVLPDPTGDIASCWGPGSQLLVTSNNLDFDDVTTPIISSVTNNPTEQITTVELAEPIEMTSYSDSESEYAVEVALLSRNIAMESSDSVNANAGGHLIFYHTSHSQLLDGVEFRKFGQAGNLGRYVSIIGFVGKAREFANPSTHVSPL
jgi:hypothetical protein